MFAVVCLCVCLYVRGWRCLVKLLIDFPSQCGQLDLHNLLGMLKRGEVSAMGAAATREKTPRTKWHGTQVNETKKAHKKTSSTKHIMKDFR